MDGAAFEAELLCHALRRTGVHPALAHAGSPMYGGPATAAEAAALRAAPPPSLAHHPVSTDAAKKKHGAGPVPRWVPMARGRRAGFELRADVHGRVRVFCLPRTGASCPAICSSRHGTKWGRAIPMRAGMQSRRTLEWLRGFARKALVALRACRTPPCAALPGLARPWWSVLPTAVQQAIGYTALGVDAWGRPELFFLPAANEFQ